MEEVAEEEQDAPMTVKGRMRGIQASSRAVQQSVNRSSYSIHVRARTSQPMSSTVVRRSLVPFMTTADIQMQGLGRHQQMCGDEEGGTCDSWMARRSVAPRVGKLINGTMSGQAHTARVRLTRWACEQRGPRNGMVAVQLYRSTLQARDSDTTPATVSALLS